jgi:hypothetical protein
MKARLTLLAATTALVIGVPSALGAGTQEATSPTDAVAYFYANERTTAATGSRQIAPERFDGVLYFRANERATAALGSTTTPYVDAFERPDPASFQASSPAASSNSGSGLAWGQIGIALGLALVLALGLVAALRFRPRRPLAQ